MEIFLAFFIISVLIIAAYKNYNTHCVDENEEREELIANLVSIEHDLEELCKDTLSDEQLKCQDIQPDLNELKVKVGSKQAEIEASVLKVSTAKTSEWAKQRKKAQQTWFTAKNLYQHLSAKYRLR